MSCPESELPPHRRRFQGQLSKFTNVVKGWQYRWFLLCPETGRLEYFLLEDRGRARAAQHLAGAVVIPSQEDGQTFSVNFASGEMYKLRAAHPRERQVWVDRLRACAHLHNEARETGKQQTSSARDLLPPTPPGARSHISNGEPSEQLQTLSLSAVDAFGSVHDIIHKVEAKHQLLLESLESLPRPPSPMSPVASSAAPLHRHHPQVLLLKATSESTLHCIEAALTLLQEVRDSSLCAPVVVTRPIPRPKSLSEAVIPGSPARQQGSSQQDRGRSKEKA